MGNIGLAALKIPVEIVVPVLLACLLSEFAGHPPSGGSETLRAKACASCEIRSQTGLHEESTCSVVK